MTPEKADQSGDVDPTQKEPPRCTICAGETVPVSIPSGIVVGGYCGDCDVITGMGDGCYAI